MKPDPIIKHGWHWSFGWLRRPECDQDGMFCYEEPDGDLVLSTWPSHKTAIYLDCRIEIKTGEKYTCFARIPRKPMRHDPSTKPANSRRNAEG
jgi:hypothetical protein